MRRVGGIRMVLCGVCSNLSRRTLPDNTTLMTDAMFHTSVKPFKIVLDIRGSCWLGQERDTAHIAERMRWDWTGMRV